MLHLRSIYLCPRSENVRWNSVVRSLVLLGLSLYLPTSFQMDQSSRNPGNEDKIKRVIINDTCLSLSHRLHENWLACENIRFSSLFAAGDVSPRETSPTVLAAKREEKQMFSQATWKWKPQALSWQPQSCVTLSKRPPQWRLRQWPIKYRGSMVDFPCILLPLTFQFMRRTTRRTGVGLTYCSWLGNF